MSIYGVLDGDPAGGGQLASTTGWGDFCRWADGAGGQLEHLTLYGWCQDLGALGKGLDEALAADSPDADTADVAEGLSRLLKDRGEATVLTITGGSGASGTAGTNGRGALSGLHRLAFDPDQPRDDHGRWDGGGGSGGGGETGPGGSGGGGESADVPAHVEAARGKEDRALDARHEAEEAEHKAGREAAEKGLSDRHDKESDAQLTRQANEEKALTKAHDREDRQVEKARGKEDRQADRQRAAEDRATDKARGKEDKEVDKRQGDEAEGLSDARDAEAQAIEDRRQAEGDAYGKTIAHLPDDEQERHWERYRQEHEPAENAEDEAFNARWGAREEEMEARHDAENGAIGDRREREDERREAARDAEDKATGDRRDAEDEERGGRQDAERDALSDRHAREDADLEARQRAERDAHDDEWNRKGDEMYARHGAERDALGAAREEEDRRNGWNQAAAAAPSKRALLPRRAYSPDQPRDERGRFSDGGGGGGDSPAEGGGGKNDAGAPGAGGGEAPAIDRKAPLRERMAAYTEGDRKVAALQKEHGEVERLRQAAEGAARDRDQLFADHAAGKDIPLPAGKRLADVMEDKMDAASAAKEAHAKAQAGLRDRALAVVGAKDPVSMKPTYKESGIHLSPNTVVTFPKEATPEMKGASGRAYDFVNSLTEKDPGRKDLAGPRIISDPGTARASYDNLFGVMHAYPDDRDESTYVHELGHHLEKSMPGVREAAQEFLQDRVGGEKPTSLREKFGNDFDRGEKGRKDEFDKAFGDGPEAYYVGKSMGGGRTEVISMGLEAFHKDPAGFAAKDPGYCKFLLGVLDGSLRK